MSFKNKNRINKTEERATAQSPFQKLLDKHTILSLIGLSSIIVLLIEMLSRRSITQGFYFIIENPVMFLFNILIVLFTLTISMLFPKRNFTLVLFTVIWLGLGIANFIILGYRSTPLTAMDFYLLKSVFSIISVYLDTVKMVLISVVLLSVVAVMLFMFRKFKKYKIQFRLPLLIIGVTSVSMIFLSTFALKVSALSEDFDNLPDAYEDYGFAYCFSNSVIERGISKPDNYSKEEIDRILQNIKNASKDTLVDENGITTQEDEQAEIKPNIIMIQLESFFDVNNLLDYSFSENPVPNFTNLKENYSHGYLTVPAYGAGTVNTEFEIISSMSLNFFGTGEYPYRTILQSTTSESICYDLAARGYRSSILHNNTGTFYRRNAVLPMLGFNNFASLEYMNERESNPTGWTKDKVLEGEIFKALEADEARDFIYTITVQSHGIYQHTPIKENIIRAYEDLDKRLKLGIPKENSEEYLESEDAVVSESHLNEIQYYVNQLNETDKFVGSLVDKLSTYDEPTVLVLYGDHLPPLSFEEEDVINANKFQTEYVIWSNFPMEKQQKDLNAYQLSPYVMEMIGYEDGILTQFHQRLSNSPTYEEDLKMLQYDMLYGDKYVFDGVNPYEPTQMKMGILDVKINQVSEEQDVLIISGENFTPSSVVYFGEDAKNTTYVDENTLTIPIEDITDVSITVAQTTDGGTVLSQSEPYQPTVITPLKNYLSYME
ncbi:MAG: Arylsulfatase [Herbinix sp.]|jgi:phosphoglycerol transferase MdoB-like AlkP superfamily enzyme|nr:Arylsulfatase [Herbinix sp.]